MITTCAICEKRQTNHRHWCDFCLTYDEMLYHQRSVVQTIMWKRKIFTDDKYDMDGLIEYHVEQYKGLKLIIKLMKEVEK